jgi:hypothetical protein
LFWRTDDRRAGIVSDTDASILGANWMFSICPPPPAEQTPSVPGGEALDVSETICYLAADVA